jgi:hypothetical protein
MLGNVAGTRHVILDAGDQRGLRVAYDYLVLAMGATHSYFGHDEFAHFAPGFKSLADAESLRNHILTAFENAETEENPRAPEGTNDIRPGGRWTDGRRDGKRDRCHVPDHAAEELPSNRPKVRTHHPGRHAAPRSRTGCHAARTLRSKIYLSDVLSPIHYPVAVARRTIHSLKWIAAAKCAPFPLLIQLLSCKPFSMSALPGCFN